MIRALPTHGTQLSMVLCRKGVLGKTEPIWPKCILKVNLTMYEDESGDGKFVPIFGSCVFVLLLMMFVQESQFAEVYSEVK